MSLFSTLAMSKFIVIPVDFSHLFFLWNYFIENVYTGSWPVLLFPFFLISIYFASDKQANKHRKTQQIWYITVKYTEQVYEMLSIS